jgi:hypothetical protein
MATPKKSSEELVNHYGAARLRMLGSGNLKLTMFSLDLVKAHVMLPLPLTPRTFKEPNRLSNFTQQRACLEVRTTQIDETFQISKVIMFIKPVAKSYPE